jgi:hypothetical protein
MMIHGLTNIKIILNFLFSNHGLKAGHLNLDFSNFLVPCSQTVVVSLKQFGICCFNMLAISQFVIILFSWLYTPGEPRPPHRWCTEITLRHSSGRGIGPLRDLYLTTHNIHKRQTSMRMAGFETAIPGSKRRQTYALDRAATRIDTVVLPPWPTQA